MLDIFHYLCDIKQKNPLTMNDYIIHNIGFTVDKKLDFDGILEPDKPIEKYPNYYFGKLIGNMGTELKLFRTRPGKGEEAVPNCVLRNDNGIILLRIHNKENITLYENPKNNADCIGIPTYNYPYSYVVIDYRDYKCQIAIEKSSVWDSKTSTVRTILEKYFKSEPFKSRGLDITVKEKFIPTEFESFLDKRLIDKGDAIESFTFQYVNLKKHPTVFIPEELTEYMEAYSKVLEIFDALEATTTVKLGEGTKDDSKIKQLSRVVAMCCDNAFQLTVNLRDYGEYTCKENIIAKFPMHESVIDNYKDFINPDIPSSDSVLSMWLDEITDKIRRYENREEIY